MTPDQLRTALAGVLALRLGDAHFVSIADIDLQSYAHADALLPVVEAYTDSRLEAAAREVESLGVFRGPAGSFAQGVRATAYERAAAAVRSFMGGTTP